MDSEALAKLKEAAARATPGPWKSAGSAMDGRYCPVVQSDHKERGYQLHDMNKVRDTDPDVWPHMRKQYQLDAEFIALANPATILALLAERQAMEEALRAHETALRYAESYELDMNPDRFRDILDELYAQAEQLTAAALNPEPKP